MTQGGDDDIEMIFREPNKVHFTSVSVNRLNGDYKYRFSKIKNDFVLMLGSYDKAREDSIQIIMANPTEDSFQLKSVIHYYSDGRPPESELLNDHTYILRKTKNN